VTRRRISSTEENVAISDASDETTYGVTIDPKRVIVIPPHDREYLNDIAVWRPTTIECELDENQIDSRFLQKLTCAGEH